MKVKSVNLSDNETSVEIDLFTGLKAKLTPEQKKTIASEVGDYLVEQTLLAVADEKSPISGGAWKKGLSKEYAKIKMDEIGNKKANIEFSGRTLDQLKVKPTDQGIKLGVFGERAPAADGHNNLSGKSALPTRQFLPKEGQKYKPDIEREVNRIVADVLTETVATKEEKLFKEVETKKDLYAAIREVIGEDLSLTELRLAVFRNKNLLDLIEENDLLDLL